MTRLSNYIQHRLSNYMLTMSPNAVFNLQYLVHYNASGSTFSSEAFKTSIESVGGTVSSYIPDHTLLVVAEPKLIPALKRLAGLSSFMCGTSQMIITSYAATQDSCLS